jgi:hypothetical protein
MADVPLNENRRGHLVHSPLLYPLSQDYRRLIFTSDSWRCTLCLLTFHECFELTI